MRKVKYFIANSLDNFIARPDGAVEWLFNDGTDYGMAEFFRSIDTILLGRKTFDFANSQTKEPKRRNSKAKRKGSVGWDMTSYVFSRTLKPEEHDDVTIISAEAGKFVRSLKSQPGKDIWLMGGGELAASLLAEDVVDEINLNIHPVLLGRGVPLFPEIANQVKLELFGSKAHKNGCMQVDYRVKHSDVA